MAEEKAVNIKTPEGRVSFPCVFEVSDYDGKFSLVLIFPKGSDLSQLKAAAKAAAVDKWGSKMPSGLKNPFRKCSEKSDIYGEDFDPDDIFVTFRRLAKKGRPGLVDAGVQPIMEQSEFYPGCWARVSTNAYAYAHEKGNKGVGFGLINIQKVRDDDPLAASGIKAEDDFDALEGSSEDPAAFGTDDDDLFGDGAAAGGTDGGLFGDDDDDIPF